jgi:GT2 family glycosyltransferase
MLIDLLVLNYNGRALLAECLPSVLRAAAASSHICRVAVIDNASSDDSLDWLGREFPQIEIIRRPNRGLCSFNDVLAERLCRAAVLLNNDIKLDADCIDRLVEPLSSEAGCFLTAARCLRFDGRTYDGQKTAVRWRWGLVQATSLFEGHEQTIDQPDLTASAGAAIAVDREKFLTLGGFDPLYLPGRLEDLDLCYRGYLAGWHARYVPEAIAYHLGAATFDRVFAPVGNQRLALRNTLLFQWKNLRHPSHVMRQAGGLAFRLLRDVCRAPWVAHVERFATWRALAEALGRVRQIHRFPHTPITRRREREFFRQFAPQRMAFAARMPA